jgi:hypothetical protein
MAPILFKIDARTDGNCMFMMQEEVKRMEYIVKECVKDAGDVVRKLMEEQTRNNFPRAGGFTRSWRSRTYPPGQPSLNAASSIWSTEGLVAAAFDHGPIIRARGSKYLCIPTQFNLPGGRGRSARSKGDPDPYQQVKLKPSDMVALAQVGMSFVAEADRAGDKLWMVKVSPEDVRGASNAKSLKAVVSGASHISLGSRRRPRVKRILRTGVVPMYYLAAQVKLPKLLDFNAAATMGIQVLDGLLTARLTR